MWVKAAKKIGLVLLAIMGGLIAILGVAFALKYEKQKLGKVKGDAIIRKAELDISTLTEKKQVLLEREGLLEEEEKAIEKEMVAKKDEIKVVRNKVKEMDSDELSKRFNELYFSG